MKKDDFDRIEQIVWKGDDDIAISIARSFERLEERIDAMESRLYGRIAELEDAVEDIKEE